MPNPSTLNSNSEYEAIWKILESKLKDIYTISLGEVSKISEDNPRKVDVQLLGKKVSYSTDGNKKTDDLPILPNVSVFNLISSQIKPQTTILKQRGILLFSKFSFADTPISEQGEIQPSHNGEFDRNSAIFVPLWENLQSEENNLVIDAENDVKINSGHNCNIISVNNLRLSGDQSVLLSSTSNNTTIAARRLILIEALDETIQIRANGDINSTSTNGSINSISRSSHFISSTHANISVRANTDVQITAVRDVQLIATRNIELNVSGGIRVLKGTNEFMDNLTRIIEGIGNYRGGTNTSIRDQIGQFDGLLNNLKTFLVS